MVLHTPIKWRYLSLKQHRGGRERFQQGIVARKCYSCNLRLSKLYKLWYFSNTMSFKMFLMSYSTKKSKTIKKNFIYLQRHAWGKIKTTKKCTSTPEQNSKNTSVACGYLNVPEVFSYLHSMQSFACKMRLQLHMHRFIFHQEVLLNTAAALKTFKSGYLKKYISYVLFLWCCLNHCWSTQKLFNWDSDLFINNRCSYNWESRCVKLAHAVLSWLV